MQADRSDIDTDEACPVCESTDLVWTDSEQLWGCRVCRHVFRWLDESECLQVLGPMTPEETAEMELNLARGGPWVGTLL